MDGLPTRNPPPGRSAPAPGYLLVLLLTLGFTLALRLQPQAVTWNRARASSDNLLGIVMGDARRMFANHFFVKADVYFHSGYYPSLFDQGRKEIHFAEQAAPDVTGAPENNEEHNYLRPPLDWLELFGRNFFNTRHTELTGAAADEILPWLRISAELDPQRVDTYTVSAYWLRGPMRRPREAEAFLREGQRANPDSYEILFELGRLYRDNFKDDFRARNLFLLAGRKLDAQEKRTGEPDLLARREILVSLSRIEEKEGHLAEAIQYLRQLHDVLPPDHEAARHELEKQIAELTQRLGTGK
jgi:tetratricopeptide (TPR) repeat protein